MSALPTATIRHTPEDFVVEEIPAYAPAGSGDHLYVTFVKRGLTTPQAVRRLAEALGASPRDAGYAGMKDRHAVTTQTASFLAADPNEAALSALGDDLTVTAVSRHNNKLKPGHLAGNRFTIRLRDLPAADLPACQERLADIAARGVPNAFGSQRFGRDGDNAERAARMIAGSERFPRDKKKARLLFSAWQSALFNQLLDARHAAGSDVIVLPGDVAHKRDSGAMFDVPLAGDELADAVARSERGLIGPTGPMFGAKMRWAQGDPGALERSVLADSGVDEAALGKHKKLGAGTRRPLRLMVDELRWEVAPEPGSEDVLIVSFVLPKGGYATTVLSHVAELSDPHRGLPRNDRD